MEQRRVRLGDIVDDYCTRERRVTNHAVVAIVEDQIQLTRCTTCDTEHPYKAARVPRRRKKSETGALYEQVLAGREHEGVADDAGLAEARLAAQGAGEEPDAGAVMLDATGPAPEPAEEPPGEPFAGPVGQEPAPETADDQPGGPALEDGPVRRPLIRATLPRPEGQPVVRQPPEFTIRQSGGRGGFRQDARGGTRNGGRPAGGQGRGGHGGGQRQGQRSGFGQGRPGSPHGGRQDRHAGQARHHRPSQHARSGKKRSR